MTPIERGRRDLVTRYRGAGERETFVETSSLRRALIVKRLQHEHPKRDSESGKET